MLYHSLASLLSNTQTPSELNCYKYTKGGRNVTINTEGMPTIFMTDRGVSIGKDWTEIDGSKEMTIYYDENHVIVKQPGYEDKRIDWKSNASAVGDSKEADKDQSNVDLTSRDSY